MGLALTLAVPESGIAVDPSTSSTLSDQTREAHSLYWIPTVPFDLWVLTVQFDTLPSQTAGLSTIDQKTTLYLCQDEPGVDFHARRHHVV